jgi:flagella basal body P-ring formation protein FlgA
MLMPLGLLPFLCGPAAHAVILAPQPKPALATVTAYPAVQVTGASITLGDLARLESSDPALLATLRQVDFGPAPLPGKERPVDMSTLVIRLRQKGINPETVSLQGPTRIQVSRAAQTIAGEEMARLAQQALLAKLQPAAGSSEEIKLDLLHVPNPVTAPLGAYEAEVQVSDRSMMGSTATSLVKLKVSGVCIASVPVQFKLQRLGEVLVADKQLDRKSTVESDCVHPEKRDLTTLPKDALRSLAEAKGLQVRSAVAAGQVLTRVMLEGKPLVEARAEVTLVALAGAIRVTTAATTLEAGRKGQSIRVLNKAANKELKATILDSQTVQAALGE